MAAVAFNEFELEGLHELEGESEFELGELGLGELESPEMFGWGDVTKWAGNQWRALQTPGTAQRRAAIAAGKSAAKGIPSAIGSRFGTVGSTIATILGDGLAAAIPDQELYGEAAFLEFSELENELSPIRRIYPDAIMEHMAHEALEAESEQEVAEGFLPLIPMLAAKVLPLAAKALPTVAKLGAKFLPKLGNVFSKVTPRLMRGVSNVARTLFRNRRTRPLVRTVPTIARRTINTIARQTAAGQTVSPATAQRVLAQQSMRVIGNPQIAQQVMRRNTALDRQYHRITGTPMRLACNCRQVASNVCPTCKRLPA